MILIFNHLLKLSSNLKLACRNAKPFKSQFSTHKSVDEIKEEVLQKAIEFVPESGWSKNTIIHAVKSLGYPAHLHGLLDNSSIDLISYFYETSNLKMVDKLDEWIESRSSEEKINTGTILRQGVEIRLKLLEPVISKWPEAITHLSHPSNMPRAAWLFRNLLDELWIKAGDKSINMSWYAKRSILGAVYASTELYMLQDSSPGFVETWHFLDRRFQDATFIGHCGKNARNLVEGSQENAWTMLTLLKNVTGIGRNL